jgi:hypothetical protein
VHFHLSFHLVANNFENFLDEKERMYSKKKLASVIPEIEFILGRSENAGLFTGAVLCVHSNSAPVCSLDAAHLHFFPSFWLCLRRWNYLVFSSIFLGCWLLTSFGMC